MAVVQLPVSEVRAQLSRLVAGPDIIEITQRGKVVAALYPEGAEVLPRGQERPRPVVVDTRDAEPRVMPPTKPDPDRVRAAREPQRIGLSKKEQAGGRYDRD